MLSGAQRHTHFLDSPRIAQSLATSDFRFADLRRELTTVFLVLPPNRRLLAPIGYIPPAEAEQAYFAILNTLEQAA